MVYIKRSFVLLGIVLFLGIMIVCAEEMPSVGVFGEDGGGADAEKLQDTIDDIVPIGDDGSIDYGKYKPFVSKAELRIAAINSWLDERVGWMRYIFHMKPAVSWLFFINVYVILWFFALLVLNADGLWFFIEKKGGAIIFGGAVFFVLMVVRLYYGISVVIYNFVAYLLTTIAESAIWVALLVLLAFVFGVGWFGIAFIGMIGVWLARYRKARDDAKRASDMKTSTEAMNALVGEVGK